MNNDLGKAFAKFGGSKSEALNEHMHELETLADSSDGQKVKAILEKSDLSAAMENGDTETMRSALAEILGTGEGQRLCSRLNEMLK